jgi:endonuclease G
MSESYESARQRQQEAARARFEAQAARRRENIEALSRPGGVAEVNTPEQLARRLDRVTRYFAGEDLPTSESEMPTEQRAPEEVIEESLVRIARTTTAAAPTVARQASEVAAEIARGVGIETAAEKAASEARAGVVLEKIIGSNDFLGIRYLEEGVAAARAVCRIAIGDESGPAGYGTGSMVSPRLLLTNHHVLRSAETARFSTAEFNYQDGPDGQPLQARVFPLDPDTFFVNDEERDFALVAVAGREGDLAQYGLNRLIAAQGKAVVGDFVTIVQHPRGDKKQVALRENGIVGELELVLHYEADTEPGSSGSPVFNDQWEIVALHHASVQTAQPPERRFLNEGIRASRILRFLAEQRFDPAAQGLLDQLHAAGPPPAVSSASHGVARSGREQLSVRAVGPDGQGLAWSIPLEVAIEVRAPATPLPSPSGPGTASPAAASASGVVTEALVEPFRDEDLANRPGYDDQFLGIEAPLPTVDDTSIVSRLDDGSHVLAYEHFSLVMHKARRLALFTASNVDADPRRKKPEEGRDYSRKGLTGLGPNDQEKWFTDPRIPAIHQLPDRFFTKDRASFDKGHIVRREDVAWGSSFDEVRRANGDTFHVTNCSPQVANFNRSNKQGVWGLLENLILKQSATERYCVFAGPVFGEDDPGFHGVDDSGPVIVAIPRQFWKIVVAGSAGELQTFAFLLDQDLSDTEFELTIDKEWRTRMVSVSDLEKAVPITFPKQLHQSDQIDASPGEALRADTGIETTGPGA